MEFEFSFNGFPAHTHCYVYSGLSCWYNEQQKVLVDFSNCYYNLHEWVDETISDILLYHINLAVIHGLIDQNMFYGECRKEGWDPKYAWNIKLILGLGMGDYKIHKFDELFEYDRNQLKNSIFVEYNYKTGRWKRPTHYYRKKRNK